MNQLTRQSLEHILGPLDENTIRALQTTGANLKDIAQAKALAEQKTDIVGSGEQDIPEPVSQALLILIGEQQ